MATQTIDMNNVTSCTFNNQSVSSIYLNNTKIWPLEENYLAFHSQNSFTLKIGDNTQHWNGTMEYSTNASTWSTWSATTTITAVRDSSSYSIYLRGTGNSKVTGSNRTNYGFQFTGSNIAIAGKLATLLDYTTVAQGNDPVMANYAFGYLFYGQTAIVNTNYLVLPNNVSQRCFMGMFSGCSNMLYGPKELPATSTQTGCYYTMFAGSGVITGPKILATTFASSCCFEMYIGCPNLTKINKLYGTTYDTNACKEMYINCLNIKMSETQTGDYTNSFRIPITGTATSTQSNSFDNMFSGTGGTFTGTPSANTTYYTSNDLV